MRLLSAYGFSDVCISSDRGGAASCESVLLQYQYKVKPDVATETAEEEEEDPDWMVEWSPDEAWLAGAYDGGAKENKICEEGGEEAKQERNIFREEFRTVHQVAVNALRTHPFRFRREPAPVRRAAGAGEIVGLYTFGAPGCSLRGLSNPLRKDGKFPGVRVLTERVERAFGMRRKYHDPVTFFAGLVGLKHTNMDALVLSTDVAPLWRRAARTLFSFPRADLAFWTQGHHQDTYSELYGPHSGRFDPLIQQMLYLSRAVDPSITDHKPERCAAEARKGGWNLVEMSNSDPLHQMDVIFSDDTALFQHPGTHACALAFVPTHHETQWMANLNFAQSTYCGIPNVHRGFRNQVRRATHSAEWVSKIQPKLANCKELYIAGHSLGSAQAQLVAACMQRAPAEGEDGWEDYKNIAWIPAADAPKSMPALH